MWTWPRLSLDKVISHSYSYAVPPRPSRNLDQALLTAGRALFPQRGCAGLSLREVADAAGVNLGMFHYHFGSREAFLRALMQQAYEEMFSTLTLEVARDGDALDHLRAALRVLGRFLRSNRPFIARVFADALSGEQCARNFMRENAPRHLGVLQEYIVEGQKAGLIRPIAVPQAIGTCAGALALPIIVGGAMAESGTLPQPVAKMIEATLLSDTAIDERIELALAAIALPAAAAAAAKPKRKSRVKS
jgi:AcrR family transcriptional regulator